jgi:hypothetical protein
MTTMSEDVIYVIMGEAGEYSDSRQWIVRAFFDEDEARRYEDMLDDYIKQRPNESRYDDGWKTRPSWTAWMNGNPYDDQFASNADDGPAYVIVSVPIGWPTKILELEKQRAEEVAKRKAEQKTRAIMLDD